MPRKARIVVPGAFHHVMARGIDGQDIFKDDADRERLLSLLESQILRCAHRLYAWALMPNHYHLLLRASDHPLADMMGRINSTYARYFNKKCGRRGYLFQDRYKSVVTQDQRYVEEILRYVHQNPVRAGLCKNLDELERYPWCGHGVIMGRRKWKAQEVKEVLARFGQSPAAARLAYRTFMGDGLGEGSRHDTLLSTVKAVRSSNLQVENMFDPGCWVIGDPEYVKAVLKSHGEHRTRLARYRREGVGLEEVALKVSRMLKVPAEEMKKRARGTPVSDARKVFAYVCRQVYGFPVKEIGRYLRIGSSPASICIAKGEKIASSKGMLIN